MSKRVTILLAQRFEKLKTLTAETPEMDTAACKMTYFKTRRGRNDGR